MGCSARTSDVGDQYNNSNKRSSNSPLVRRVDERQRAMGDSSRRLGKFKKLTGID